MAAKTPKQRRAARAASRRRRRKQNCITLLVLLVTAAVILAVLVGGFKRHNAEKEEASAPLAATSLAAPSGQTDGASRATQAGAVPSDEVTAKGYTIERRDGVAYIEGVAVVNKSYTVPADYGPGGLTDECAAAFSRLQAAAGAEDLVLYAASGYRSYALQEKLYDRYVAEDGRQNADRYSARPGSSEHQTGLAIDLNDVSDTFGDTPEGQWVASHCAEYGFILRYPKGKEDATGYMYEPWHIRFVGEEFAKTLTESGLCLEEYFGISSVYDT